MDIKVPDLGVENAEVSEIMVNVGDLIAVNDNILLLESDKASVEVPATSAGKIVQILVNVGDKVKEGDVLMTVEMVATHQEVSEKPQQITEQISQPQSSSTEIRYQLPDLGVEEAQVSELMVTEGDVVEKDQAIVLVESDKASVEVPAPITGKVVKLLIQAGDMIKNGQDFIIIAGNETEKNVAIVSEANSTETKSDTKKEQNQSADIVKQPETAITQSTLTEQQVNQKLTNVYAGPAVRKMTRQLGVDISQVIGTGIRGRILKEDVFAFVKQRLQSPVVTQKPTIVTDNRSGLPNLPDMSNAELWGEIERQELSRLQKVSIPQLNYNTYLPQVTQFDLSDITDTEKLRGELKDELKKQGISLTILAFIMKATAYALMQYPKFNSHLTDDNSQIIVRKTVNMGFAVATDDGLTVPVIKDVQNKGIKQIAKEIGELAEKARNKKLGTKELTGASFTISSQGNLGGTAFTPLVNWPQVGILGVSEASMQPRWNVKTQSFEPRLMLPLSLSYDHRVINGADAAVFTRYIAKLLADPRRILL